MKEYPTIQGPNKAPRSRCIAFYKYDGSNIRLEWSKKRGFYKFGSKKVLIDRTDELGEAIDLFLETYGNDLEKIFLTHKMFRGCQLVTIFCEFFGENSFAGQHEPDDSKEIILLDINIHKKGIMLPSDFIKVFGHLKIPEIVYEGNFTNQFVKDVKNGMYPVREGIVAKGSLPNRKRNHSLWMAKCKTKWWMDRLRTKAEKRPDLFSGELQDNMREQNYE